MPDYWKTYTYQKKDDAALKQLAADMSNGLVFTNYHLPEDKWADMIDNVFLGLKLQHDEHFDDAMNRNNINFVYERLDKAIRYDKDYPVFTTFNLLDKSDGKKVLDWCKQMEEAKEKAANEHAAKNPPTF